MITREIIDKVQNETDIVSLVSEFVTLEKAGSGYRGLCPFHDDKNPSFSVSPDKNIAMCMSCQQGGRPIKFYQTIKNITFNEAVVDLAKKLGIKVTHEKSKSEENLELYELMDDATIFYQTYLNNSESGDKVLKYLKRREINNKSINHFKLGYAPNLKDALYKYLNSKDYSTTDMLDLGLIKRADDGSYYDFFRNRLIFPITDEYNKVVGFSARSLSKNDNVKYINSPDTKLFKKTNILYNLSNSRIDINRLNQVIIFEGFFDVIRAHQENIKNSIASMGTAFTNNQINLIKSVTKNTLIAFDGDEAGVNAALDLSSNMIKNKLNVEVIKMPKKYDPDDYIKKHGEVAFNKLIKTSVDAYEFAYNHFYKQTNLSNVNDVSSFIKNIENILKGANPTVVAIYKKRLAKDLNIDESKISLKVDVKDQVIFDERFVPKKETVKTKYEQAEIKLIILMIRSKEWHDKLKSRLRITDSSNTLLTNIRTKLDSYYTVFNDLDFNDYKNTLNANEFDYFEKHIQKDHYWINQTKLDKDEIDDYVELLKDNNLIRRREYLIGVIAEKATLNIDYSKELKEYSEIDIKLKS